MEANYRRKGCQRDWFWRGWHIRYTYLRPVKGQSGSDADRPTLPILLLHGFGSALGQWRSNLQALNESHCVYALDFLGFGASQKAPAAYNVNLWADLVYDFWCCFIGQPAVIVGHSLGSLVGLTAAIDHPEIALGLALFTLPDAQTSQPPSWARAMEQAFASPVLLWPLFKLVTQRWLLRSVLQSIYIRRELVDDELVALFATPPRDKGALDTFCRLARSRSHSHDYSPKTVAQMLPQLSIPVLLLWGNQDRIVPLAGFRKLLDQLQLSPVPPQFQLVEIDNAGHCAYDEYPAIVNQQILTWIQSAVVSA